MATLSFLGLREWDEKFSTPMINTTQRGWDVEEIEVLRQWIIEERERGVEEGERKNDLYILIKFLKKYSRLKKIIFLLYFNHYIYILTSIFYCIITFTISITYQKLLKKCLLQDNKKL